MKNTNDKSSEKSMKIPPFYSGGSTIMDWEMRHAVAQIIKGVGEV